MKQGFTLIELLIVIGIIGMISTISVTSFTSAREKARIVAGQATSKTMNDLLADDAMGSFSFDECSGTTVTDYSGTNHDGTIYGAANWSTDTRNNSGCSLRFNGSNYVEGPSNWTVAHNSFTVTAWFKTSYNSEQIMITSGNEDIVELHSGRFHFDLAESGSSPLGTKKVNDNKWHFVVVTGDNQSMRVYVDGSTVPDLEIPPQTDVYDGELLIGRCAAGYNFRGYLDDVRIYQRSITAMETQRLYASQSASHLAEL